jgi:hypothetical protein
LTGVNIRPNDVLPRLQPIARVTEERAAEECANKICSCKVKKIVSRETPAAPAVSESQLTHRGYAGYPFLGLDGSAHPLLN